MLVLSRKASEAIWVGPGVKVSVLKIERNHVRLGIEAPGSVTILRAELVDDDRDAPIAGHPAASVAPKG